MAVQEKHNEHHYIHNYNVSLSCSYSTICFKHLSITNEVFQYNDLTITIVISVNRSSDNKTCFFKWWLGQPFLSVSTGQQSLYEQADTVQVVVVSNKKYQVEARASRLRIGVPILEFGLLDSPVNPRIGFSGLVHMKNTRFSR